MVVLNLLQQIVHVVIIYFDIGDKNGVAHIGVDILRAAIFNVVFDIDVDSTSVRKRLIRVIDV